MDIQLFLIIVLAILTISIIIVCVYVVIVLRQLNTIVKKVTSTVEHAHNLVSSFSNPVVPLVGTLETIAEGVKALKHLKNEVIPTKNSAKKLSNQTNQSSAVWEVENNPRESTKHERTQKSAQPIVEDIVHVKDQISSLFDIVEDSVPKKAHKKKKNFFKGTF